MIYVCTIFQLTHEEDAVSIVSSVFMLIFITGKSPYSSEYMYNGNHCMYCDEWGAILMQHCSPTEWLQKKCKLNSDFILLQLEVWKSFLVGNIIKQCTSRMYLHILPAIWPSPAKAFPKSSSFPCCSYGLPSAILSLQMLQQRKLQNNV